MPVMVNCLLTPDSDIQTLYLQYVKGKAAREYIPITDAKVYVTAVFVSRLDTLNFHYIDENRWESEDDPLKIAKEPLFKQITPGDNYLPGFLIVEQFPLQIQKKAIPLQRDSKS